MTESWRVIYYRDTWCVRDELGYEHGPFDTRALAEAYLREWRTKERNL